MPPNLHVLWTREYAPRVQTWEDPLNQDLMTFDRVFEPIVLGDRLFIGFNDRDKVVAIDANTGREAWTFFTEGPVRLPPAGWNDRVYFASDDGYLYCVMARDGALIWKHRGGPSARKVLGNSRVISAWPARGGPVVRDGVVYFAASIWPFMGTFIYALDASSGSVLWVNDGTGAQYIKQPHSAAAFAGVAPQGALVATRDVLLVPGGRSVPAGFDRKTGRFLYYQLEDGGKGNGGSFVAATDSDFFVHTRARGTRAYEVSTGKKGTFTMNEPVLGSDTWYSGQPNSYLKTAVVEAEQKLSAAKQAVKDAKTEVAKADEETNAATYKKATNNLATAVKKVAPAEQALAAAQKALSNGWAGHVVQAVGRDKKLKWEIVADASGDIIKAGAHLFAAGTNSIIKIDLPKDGAPASVVWSNRVSGHVTRLLAANGKLFAVTLEGQIIAFGDKGRPGVRLAEHFKRPTPPLNEKVKNLLWRADARGGYALWYGVDDVDLLEAVLAHSELQIVVVEEDSRKIAQLRRRFDAAGWHGSRISFHVGDPLSFKAPPYVANLTYVSDSVAPHLSDPIVLNALYESVRPYGGAIWVSQKRGNASLLAQHLRSANLPQAKTEAQAGGIWVVRSGALPGSADWTHQYGDAANTVKSDDRLVKLPLGLLWFGGNTHMDVLPRHGHGPSEQVAGGRLFIEGMDCLSARDVYTGRVLWKREFGDLGNYGVYYDSSYTNTPLSIAYNQKHIPGANARGGNYVVAEDAVYIITPKGCEMLSARTGQRLRLIEMPRRPGETNSAEWGFIGITGDILLGGAGFAHYTTRLALATNATPNVVDLSASRGLVAFNRKTGQPLWRIEAKHGFIHNGVVMGNDRVYCLDKLPKSAEDKLKRRGRVSPADYRIAAYGLRDGRLLWEAKTNIFGTWLSYSKTRDILLQAGASATDRLKDEAAQGMITYQGADGTVLWKNLDLKYTGPCVIHRDTIITTPTSYKASVGGYSLLDGTARAVLNPLTGVAEPLRIYRTYGCNYPVACENLVTFRSGAAGYYDLETHSGTGNFGGFKSGCSANLIAADGVLNAPDYTRTCTCAYQNQTSLALVHMPELEFWTHNQFGIDSGEGARIRRVGVNFGAPGDRRAENGTLWLDYPSVGGSSPNLSINVTGKQTNYFRYYASAFAGEGPSWVFASGLRGADSISITPQTRRTVPPPAPKKKAEDGDPDEDDAKDSAKKGSATNAVTNRVVVASSGALSPAPYTVRLYFAEPEKIEPGERVFDVQLQGKTVLRNFDIVASAGGPRRGVAKEFRNVLVTKDLNVSFKTAGTKHGALISGIEMFIDDTDEFLPAGE